MNGRRSGSATAAATAADPLAKTPRGARNGRLGRAALDEPLERAVVDDPFGRAALRDRLA
jgi:hypothetical protein